MRMNGAQDDTIDLMVPEKLSALRSRRAVFGLFVFCTYIAVLAFLEAMDIRPSQRQPEIVLTVGLAFCAFLVSSTAFKSRFVLDRVGFGAAAMGFCLQFT